PCAIKIPDSTAKKVRSFDPRDEFKAHFASRRGSATQTTHERRNFGQGVLICDAASALRADRSGRRLEATTDLQSAGLRLAATCTSSGGENLKREGRSDVSAVRIEGQSSPIDTASAERDVRGSSCQSRRDD